MNKHYLVSGLVTLLWVFQATVSGAQWRQPDAKWLYKTVNDVELKLHVFTPEGHQKKYIR